MTKQITVKLNEKIFRPALDNLMKFGGYGITESDSDLTGKCIFFCYDYVTHKRPELGNKTLYEFCMSRLGEDQKAKELLAFVERYYKFKKSAK